jgi:hypothetical protein
MYSKVINSLQQKRDYIKGIFQKVHFPGLGGSVIELVFGMQETPGSIQHTHKEIKYIPKSNGSRNHYEVSKVPLNFPDPKECIFKC